MSTKKFDFVIFGASGFTGQYVVEEAAVTVGQEGGLSWAVAGRNTNKLQKVLNSVGNQLGKSLDEIPILIADVSNKNSIIEMCEQAKVILNCVGPYQLYGDILVQACIETKTHHIDLCGEPCFLEKSQVLYDSKAKEAGVYILQSCGFDSIPAEMGVIYTAKQLPDGDMNDVESYLLIQIGPKGSHGNIGTWQSAVLGFAHAAERANYRRQLCAKPLPKPAHRMIKRSTIFYSNDVNSWTLPFFGSDRSIVTRSQRYNYEVKGQRPIQFNAFMRVNSIFHVAYFCLMGLVFGIFSKFSFGRWLMLKFPRLMSLGVFSSEGPTREQIKESSFNMTFIGRGFSNKIQNPEEQHTEKLDRRIVTRLSGPEPGYDATPICMLQAAYILLKEQDKLPKGGGVFTPGVAFADTSMIDRLDKRNIVMRVLEK